MDRVVDPKRIGGAIAADIYRVTIVEALDSWLAEGSTGRDLKCMALEE